MTVTTKAPLVVIPRTDVKAAGKTAAAQTSIAYKTCSFVCSSLAPVADTAAAALKTALVTTVNVAIENSSLSQAMKTSLKTSADAIATASVDSTKQLAVNGTKGLALAAGQKLQDLLTAAAAHQMETVATTEAIASALQPIDVGALGEIHATTALHD